MDKEPIGIKIEGDPYKEVADIVEKWCQQNYYSSGARRLTKHPRL